MVMVKDRGVIRKNRIAVRAGQKDFYRSALFPGLDLKANFGE